MTSATVPIPPAPRQVWSAVGSMSMRVALLIAAKFMPVSLLPLIAADLHAAIFRIRDELK